MKKAFETIKAKMCSTLVLKLPDFNKPFGVEYDASGTEIGAVLLQSGRPIVYFSEKINQSRLNYSAYGK